MKTKELSTQIRDKVRDTTKRMKITPAELEDHFSCVNSVCSVLVPVISRDWKTGPSKIKDRAKHKDSPEVRGLWTRRDSMLQKVTTQRPT